MKTKQNMNKGKSMLNKLLAVIALVVVAAASILAAVGKDSITALFADNAIDANATTTALGDYTTYDAQNFPYTGGQQTYTVPENGYYKLEVWGAEGGGSRLSGNTNSGLGGKGGYATGTVYLTAGTKLNIYVGGQGKSSTSGTAAGGYNGGGAGYASSESEPGNGGGGATDIRISGTTLYYRAIVAGGGGRRWRRLFRHLW